MKLLGRSRVAVSACALFVAAAGFACGGDDGPEPLPAGELSRADTFLSLMALVPDVGQRLAISYTDYEFARETFGIPLPPAGASREEIDAYRDALLIKAEGAGSSPLSGFIVSYDSEAWDTEVGFGVTNVDQEVRVELPPDATTILKGRFDPQHIGDAVHTDPKFSADLEVHRHRGLTYYAWLEDFERVLTGTSFRPGRYGGRLSTDSQFLLWALWTDGMKAMLDAKAGNEDTLAELDTVRAMAQAIEDLNAYTLYISTESPSLDDPEIHELVTFEYGEENIQRVEDEGLLQSYTALGVGYGYDGTAHTAVLVYVYETESQAQENAGRLREILADGVSLAVRTPWNEQITSSSVGVHGVSVHASLRAGSPRLGMNAWNNLDTLVLTKDSRPPVTR